MYHLNNEKKIRFMERLYRWLASIPSSISGLLFPGMFWPCENIIKIHYKYALPDPKDNYYKQNPLDIKI